jgi:hypothetical protein
MTFNERVEYLTSSKIPAIKGVAFPVVLGAGGFFTRTDGMETILNGIKQLLLTNRGERVMRPDFGTSLRRAVFEPADFNFKEGIESEIIATITRYEPRVVVKGVNVHTDDTQGQEGYHRVFVQCKLALKSDTLQERILEIII